MVPVSNAAANTQWLCEKGCDRRRPGNEMSVETTKVGIRLCTFELVPGGEGQKKRWHNARGRAMSGMPKATSGQKRLGMAEHQDRFLRQDAGCTRDEQQNAMYIDGVRRDASRVITLW